MVTDEAPTRISTPVRLRINGIDMARALAMVGMVMVHIGPQEAADPGLAAAAYRSAHGRAAILFIVLAGIGVSLLIGDRSTARLETATTRLAWRAVVLLPAGLALQTLEINVAVILQYYAVYFLLATALMRLSDRLLLLAAALSATLGPALIIWLQQTAPWWFQSGVPDWHDASRIMRDIMITGYYPVVVWAAPLTIGMWTGRRQLRERRVAIALCVGGIVAATAGFVLSDTLVARLGAAFGPDDWRQLYLIEPHNEMPLWVLTSTAIATALVGMCLLVARALPRFTWPLVAFGQLALTTYVAHLLVLELRPQWLLRDAIGQAWISVARFTVVGVVLATVYRTVAARGPFEMLLRPAWSRPARPAAAVSDASGRTSESRGRG